MDLIPSQGANVDASYVQGYLSFQKNRREDQAEGRAERALGMAEQKFGQETQLFEKEQALQAGMAMASQQGGYEAVIDYLKQTDPERAIKFTKSKLDLDRDMMKNEAYSALLPTQKAQALAEGYGILGNMGMALLKAPENDRAGLYQQMLPIVKTVNPEAPDTLNNDAVNMLALGAYQAMPANVLYAGNKENIKYQSQVGKALSDYQSAVAAYGENSGQARVLLNNIENLSAEQSNVQARMMQTRLRQQNANENTYRKEFLKQTDDMATINSQYNNVITAFSNANLPDGTMKGPDDMAGIYAYMKLMDPNSIVMPGEYATAANSGSVPTRIRLMYNNALKGDKLDPEQRKAFMKTATAVMKTKLDTYNVIKQNYTDLAQQNGLNLNNVVLPRTELEQVAGVQIPVDIQKQAMDAIAQGAPKEAVMQKLQSMFSQERNIDGQQQPIR